MNQIVLAIALGAAALSNFPRDEGGRISQPAIGIQLGGAPAVVVPAGERVVAVRADGSPAPGFALSFGADDAASGAAAAADMDGDGRLEIAVATASGKLFLWSGGAAGGFPVSLRAPAKAGPSFGDVDGDGRLEILVGDEQGRVHAFKKGGREAAGWPATVGKPVTSSVSSSVFAGGRSFAFGCEDGRVHVLDGSGKERPGFPLVTKFAVSGAPAFVDLDDDGEMDLVVASQDFGVYAVNASGAALPGFPVRAGYRLYEGPAIADLDGDGRLDVVFASADGMVHAVNSAGEKLPGFPVRVGVRLFGGASIADLDRDGALDVVAVAADGAVAAFNAKGKPLPGFPHPLASADVGASPLLYDIAGDGTPAIFVGLPTGQLHALRAARSGTAVARVAWGGPARDPARTARHGPNPPSYKALSLSPATPRVTDSLKASWRPVWLDARPGEGAPAPKIEWLRNGKAVPGLDGKKELPAGTARRGERWRFVLSSAGGAAVAESAEVRVLDSAPGAPAVALEPKVPSRAGPVKAVVAKPAADADGDALTYEVGWVMDGLDTGVRGDTFPGDRLRKGALLVARIAASDGELGGPPGSAMARVGDTAPGAAKVGIEPAAPTRADPIRARIEAPATDPDGDPLRYRYRWKVDGVPRNLPLFSTTLPPGLFRKRQKIEVEVRAFDGELEGPPVRAEVVARNTPPAAPRVEIRPERPRKGDPLFAAVVAPAEDADRDPIAYRFAWKKNGEPLQVGGEGREVAGSEVTRADHFELTVTASDGEATSSKTTAVVSVSNTPPRPPRIAIEPDRPKGGQPLKLVVLEPAQDADGQTVTLAVAWTRDDKPTGGSDAVLQPTQFRKHERVRVTVTPRDGEDSGEPAKHETEIADAPPTAPGVAFAPERPTVTQPLRALVKTQATDPDGDKLEYQYRFLCDGAPVELADTSARSKVPPYWTSTSEVPTSRLKKGQRWEVEVRASDGEMTGPVGRALVTVANSPPPAPKLLFTPERPRRVDGIQVAIEQPADPDGDQITYRYAWTRNGEKFDAPPDQAQIPRAVAKKGQRWAVQVVASDGEAESAAVRHEVVVADTAPGPTAVGLCDGPVPAGTVLQARITVASIDADGDPVTYRHDWTVNGKPIPSASGQARLTSPSLKKHDRARVVVTPFDGDLAGPPAVAECDVVDTPPTAPVAALEPLEATAARGVSVAIRKPSADRDGDAVTYRYRWTRDGLPYAHGAANIPPNAMKHGEVWRVVVTPYDGEEEGEPVSLQTVVKNTPPPVPSVALTPPSPVVGQPLACEARAPERDADQEPVVIHYQWLRNDRSEALGRNSPTLPVGLARRGERWRCEAWASDGFAESAHGGAEVTVRNSAPGAPEVAIEPEMARRGDDLSCRVSAAAVDPDGDDVTYAIAWAKDGKAVPAGSDPWRVESSRVAKGQRWRCTATPTDGTASGDVGAAEIRISNSPPGPAIVRLEPEAPKDGAAIRCEVIAKSEDPDGDAVRYRFAWQRNGAAQPFAETSADVPARLVKRGDRWRCTATPTDGTEEGPPAWSEEGTVGEAAEQPAPPTAALTP